MKKLMIIAIMLCGMHAFGQEYKDKIYTPTETIECRITLINEYSIFYNYLKKNQVKSDVIAITAANGWYIDPSNHPEILNKKLNKNDTLTEKQADEKTQELIQKQNINTIKIDTLKLLLNNYNSISGKLQESLNNQFAAGMQLKKHVNNIVYSILTMAATTAAAFALAKSSPEGALGVDICGGIISLTFSISALVNINEAGKDLMHNY